MAATNSMPGAICQAFAANTPLVNYFAADGLPGCWNDEASEDKKLPFTTVKVETGHTDWDSGGFGIQESDIRFDSWAETAAASEAGAVLIQTCFDAVPSVVTFNSYLMMSFLRTTPPIPEAEEQRSKSGEIVYSTRVTYHAMVQVQR